MMDDEIDNMKNLLELWQTSQVDFMPISDVTESMYIYCDKNFADLLNKKIELMEKHKNDTPLSIPILCGVCRSNFRYLPKNI